MKRKFLIIFMLMFVSMIIAGCGNNQEDAIIANIWFTSTDHPEDSIYEDLQFEINTEVYVWVEFTFYNYDSVEDIIDFRVYLPGVETYSAYDYSSGPLEPRKIDTDVERFTTEGVVTMIEISGMQFQISPERETYHYTYSFKIVGSQVRESATFEAWFISSDNMLVSGTTKFTTEYSFVDAASEGGEEYEKLKTDIERQEFMDSFP